VAAALVSTVPAVKAALVTLLTTAINDTTVQVTYGRPADSMLQRECVWVGRATGTDRVPTIKAGRKAREERYAVDVVFWVAKPRGTTQEAETRAFELLESAENVLADDPSLGNLDGLVHATAGTWEADADVANEGPYALLVLEVDCVARLA
jgi:hypothetical protein